MQTVEGLQEEVKEIKKSQGAFPRNNSKGKGKSVGSVVSGSDYYEVAFKGLPRYTPRSLVHKFLTETVGEGTVWKCRIQDNVQTYPSFMIGLCSSIEDKKAILNKTRDDPFPPFTLQGKSFPLQASHNETKEEKARTKAIRTGAFRLHQSSKKADTPLDPNLIKFLYGERCLVVYHTPIMFYAVNGTQIYSHDPLPDEELTIDMSTLAAVCAHTKSELNLDEWLKETLSDLDLDNINTI